MKEVWKPIKGYEGFYEISNYGRVKRLKFVNMYVCKEKVKVIKPQKRKNGYLQVILHNGQDCSEKLVHRLVAEAFLSREDGKDFVNHKDGNKANNNVENLEWCTRSENMIHAYRNGLAKSSAKGKFGKDSASAKAVEMLDEHGNVLMRFGSLIDAAHFVGARRSSNICTCCKGYGNRKIAYGYMWRYAD